MSTETRGRTPAYPVSPFILPNGVVVHEGSAGMSMRDAAALAALQGFLASGKSPNPLNARKGEKVDQYWARRAFNVADAFIAARDTKET